VPEDTTALRAVLGVNGPAMRPAGDFVCSEAMTIGSRRHGDCQLVSESDLPGWARQIGIRERSDMLQRNHPQGVPQRGHQQPAEYGVRRFLCHLYRQGNRPFLV
jgi:hypothetical protein